MWAKQLEGEMTRGKHVITFSARSPVGSQRNAPSSSCQFIVHIKDIEPPKAQNCPKSFATHLDPGNGKKRVVWDEPVFYDNVKVSLVGNTKSYDLKFNLQFLLTLIIAINF